MQTSSDYFIEKNITHNTPDKELLQESEQDNANAKLKVDFRYLENKSRDDLSTITNNLSNEFINSGTVPAAADSNREYKHRDDDDDETLNEFINVYNNHIKFDQLVDHKQSNFIEMGKYLNFFFRS